MDSPRWTTFWWSSVLHDRGANQKWLWRWRYDEDRTIQANVTKRDSTRSVILPLATVMRSDRKLLLITYCNHSTKPSPWSLITMRIPRFWSCILHWVPRTSVIWRRRWECIEGAHSHGIIWSKIQGLYHIVGRVKLRWKVKAWFRESLFQTAPPAGPARQFREDRQPELLEAWPSLMGETTRTHGSYNRQWHLRAFFFWYSWWLLFST